MWGLPNLPQNQAPGPGTWNGFWTLSLTNEQRKHPNIVLQQQVRDLHKEREGRGSNTGPAGAAWVGSRNSQEPGSRFTPQLHFRETQRSSPCGRDHPGLDSGVCAPHPKHRQVSSPSERVWKDKDCSEQRGKGRAGMSGTPCPPPRPRLPVPLRFVLGEMKANCSQTAGPERAVNSLGSLTRVCRLLCRKGTRESPCGAVGSFGAH